MSGAQIGSVNCSACGFERARVNEGKNGTLSIVCSECGSLTMVKSPKAVATLRQRLTGAAAPKDDKKEGGKDSFAAAIFGDDS